ncbi:DUF6920 family protein [Fusibacter sp. JL216-2]|uniref:DUF6920 family protein n=1 Tax=Fusibacter sp. JL216-2 TaxID=3071453 RepID=UPI003D34CAEE
MRILYIALAIGIIGTVTFFVVKNSFETKSTGRFDALSARQKIEKDKILIKKIEDLPEPIRRWLSQCGALSKLDIQYMDMKHVGEMRLDPESNKWLSAKATQRVGVLEPGFAWQVKADVAPGLRVLGLDSLIEGRAEMVIRLLGVFPVANVKDTPEVNESTMHRYLLEMGWYPQLALHKDISWTAIDKNTAKASLQAGDSDVSVIIEINDKGQFIGSKAYRYYDGKDDLQRRPFEGRVTSHTVFDGVEIPREMEAVWMLESGPFKWYKVKVVSAEFH